MGSQFYLQSNSTSSTSITPSISQSSRPGSGYRTQSYGHSPSPHPTRRQPPTSLAISLANDFPSDSSDDDADLPFPAPLPRSDFLQPGPFDPSAYLSTVVKERYQTLEDLRGELRTRAQNLNTELVELVNAHQEEFMGLGNSLKGGEEKIEEVRVGVLGLSRELEDVRGMLEERERDVARWLDERRDARRRIELARSLLEFGEAVEELEGNLGLKKRVDDIESEDGTSEEEEDDENEDEDDNNDPLRIPMDRLVRRSNDFLRIARLAERSGDEHPLIQSHRPRLAKCRELILSELNGYLLRPKNSNMLSSPDRKMALLHSYRQVKYGEAGYGEGTDTLGWL